jgi:hypothetical protein
VSIPGVSFGLICYQSDLIPFSNEKTSVILVPHHTTHFTCIISSSHGHVIVSKLIYLCITYIYREMIDTQIGVFHIYMVSSIFPTQQ